MHTVEEDIHNLHPELKSKLTPGDKCWQNETIDILEKCDLCTGKITNMFSVIFMYFRYIEATNTIDVGLR